MIELQNVDFPTPAGPNANTPVLLMSKKVMRKENRMSEIDEIKEKECKNEKDYGWRVRIRVISEIKD